MTKSSYRHYRLLNALGGHHWTWKWRSRARKDKADKHKDFSPWKSYKWFTDTGMRGKNTIRIVGQASGHHPWNHNRQGQAGTGRGASKKPTHSIDEGKQGSVKSIPREACLCLSDKPATQSTRHSPGTGPVISVSLDCCVKDVDFQCFLALVEERWQFQHQTGN